MEYMLSDDPVKRYLVLLFIFRVYVYERREFHRTRERCSNDSDPVQEPVSVHPGSAINHEYKKRLSLKQ